MKIRPAIPSDRESLADMFAALWLDETRADHARAIDEILAGTFASTLPYALFVAEIGAEPNKEIAGFAQAGLRSHSDGCESDRPAGYLEGWFVQPAHRKKSVGAALVRAVEEWSRAQGCVEMGSDTWLDNEGSILAHKALGFEVADSVVIFRKSLV